MMSHYPDHSRDLWGGHGRHQYLHLIETQVTHCLSHVSATANSSCSLHMQKDVRIMSLPHALQKSVLVSLQPSSLCLFAPWLLFSLPILQHGRQQGFELEEHLRQNKWQSFEVDLKAGKGSNLKKELKKRRWGERSEQGTGNKLGVLGPALGFLKTISHQSQECLPRKTEEKGQNCKNRRACVGNR